ncbi:exported hypothetical protein [Candidatus Zixiibacteriota bacterium]|nr:exported hypothetical protein [candidate division Zixibacteria bacterium]
MHQLLMVLFLLNPIVPKNPVAQDTVEVTNIHFTVGARVGGELLKPGPEAGVKLEYLLTHPVIVRVSADLNTAYVSNFRFPEGRKKSLDLAFETLAYRGRDKFTVFLGLGAVLSLSSFDLHKQMPDSVFPVDTLVSPSQIYKTRIENGYGYRIILGFRYQVHYSFEFGFQEIRPNFSFWSRDTEGQYIIYRKAKLSTLRFTIGYLFHP